jgi:hypothetical protein
MFVESDLGAIDEAVLVAIEEGMEASRVAPKLFLCQSTIAIGVRFFEPRRHWIGSAKRAPERLAAWTDEQLPRAARLLKSRWPGAQALPSRRAR